MAASFSREMLLFLMMRRRTLEHMQSQASSISDGCTKSDRPMLSAKETDLLQQEQWKQASGELLLFCGELLLFWTFPAASERGAGDTCGGRKVKPGKTQSLRFNFWVLPFCKHGKPQVTVVHRGLFILYKIGSAKPSDNIFFCKSLLQAMILASSASVHPSATSGSILCVYS
jgi:hypothetical protein